MPVESLEVSPKGEDVKQTNTEWDTLSSVPFNKDGGVQKEEPESDHDKEPRWEDKSIFDKEISLTDNIDSFLRRHDYRSWRKYNGDGFFFKNGPFATELSYTEERKERITRARIRWNEGGGYKDIAVIEKIVAKDPDLKEEADYMIAHIRELDAHDGMTPKEYKNAQKLKGETKAQ